MPTSASYAATYLQASSDQVGSAPTPLGRHRFKVAGALYVLQNRLRDGMSQANAQAYVAGGTPTYIRPVIGAAGDLGNQAILTDFQAIDSL